MVAAGAANDAFNFVHPGAMNKEMMQFKRRYDILRVLKDILHRSFSPCFHAREFNKQNLPSEPVA